ncbi:hypothetical protein BO70DRAFT_42117 [Aspergillus heteromorphus CBS 117.55]|uniref:Uncharacterized protein n=1 Tax=Aspergillus heteromorphus CBS 117.55 TaxID=1448321 RepID=A0A317W9E0_9EURO|nr:uncharacterized protein BO70DRAFT_42117 [Aspergillus heteromorphus CBS 117.55]PWY81927.1 hypothetical protein BO70DRAFT_42117 [Aspergillus heteromorphus CBS 117.55]
MQQQQTQYLQCRRTEARGSRQHTTPGMVSQETDTHLLTKQMGNIMGNTTKDSIRSSIAQEPRMNSMQEDDDGRAGEQKTRSERNARFFCQQSEKQMQ